MSSVAISNRAKRELIDIYLHGIGTFGFRQAERYAVDLEHCFSLLADNPRMGRPAERIGLGVRRHEHGSHVILYRETRDGVPILAVVHGRSLRGLEL